MSAQEGAQQAQEDDGESALSRTLDRMNEALESLSLRLSEAERKLEAFRPWAKRVVARVEGLEGRCP